MKYLLAALALALAGASAAPTPAAVPSCAFTIFPVLGNYRATGTLHGPGLALAGAGGMGSPASMWVWIRNRVAGNAPGKAGNLVVLRASGSDLYDLPLYKSAAFASEQTVLIPPCATSADLERASHVVDRADALFFSGGDQSNYTIWKGSGLIEAVKRVYARGGVVGGGSAGLAIQGAIVYDAAEADRFNADTYTPDAVRHPLERRISFTTGLFSWPSLADTITDTHFVARDRFGRLVVFLARILKIGLVPAGHAAYGLGVDEGSAVVVDSTGWGEVLNTGTAHGAYLVEATRQPDFQPDTPIRYTVRVSHVARNGARFDLLHKKTGEPWYAVTVDGSRSGFYDVDPYGK